MKKMEKHFYETPVTEVIVVARECVICASGGPYPPWGEEVI